MRPQDEAPVTLSTPCKTFAAAIALALLAVPLSAVAQGVPDTLGKIRAAKQINVAYSGDSLPFSFVGPNNAAAGYSIDLCNKVIAAVGRAVGEPNLRVNWMVGTVAERLAMVKSGRADIECANTTATLSRMAEVDFSSLVFVDGGGFLVRSDSTINRFADLTGKRVGVIAGTTTEQRLTQMMKERLVNANVIRVREGPEAVAMMEAGSMDAFASDKIKLVGLAANARDPGRFALLAEDLSFEPYAFAVPRGDSSFRLVVNRALTQVYVSGDIEGIFKQWLGKLGRPSGLLAAMYLLNAIPE